MKPALLLLLATLNAPAAPAELTIDDAVALALRHHPETRAIRAAEAVAAAQLSVARALKQPEFRFSRNNLDFDPLTFEERSTLGLRFYLPRPLELNFKQQAARARQGVAASESRAAEARLAVETRWAFRKAVIAEERSRVAARLAELRRELHKTVLRQVSAGLKEADESELAALGAAEAESELRRAASQAETERRTLHRLIDGAGAMEWVLAPQPALLDHPAPLPPGTALWALASESRAELEAAAMECRLYQAAESLARHERYPWLSFAQVTHRTTPMIDRGAWGFQLGVELPLFRTAASAQARLAAAQRTRCELERQALQARIQAEVEERASALHDLRRELEELERLRAGPATRAATRLHTALAAGTADQVEVLNAEARLLNLRDRWLQKRLQYAAAEAQLEAALGEEVTPSPATP